MNREHIIEASPVLTNDEAARYLRLDTDHPDMGSAVRSLHRLVQEGRLQPITCGSRYRFSIDELNRFISDPTSRLASETLSQNGESSQDAA